MKIDDAPVVVEQTYNVPVQTVWNAITEIDQMCQWYFDNVPSFKPEVGFTTQFDVKSDDRIFPHVWTVTEVDPMKLIRYDWRFEGYPGDSFVAFELSGKDDVTTLKLTHEVRESFPDDIPEFERESCVAGWTYFIKERLRDFLARNH